MFFDQILEAQPDPVFGLLGAFHADARPQKINLMVGIYKDEHLQSKLLPAVLKAKEKAYPLDQRAEYLPFEGLPEFTGKLGEIVFGEQLWKENSSRIYSAQSVGGTSALRIGAEFLFQCVSQQAAIPHPTWPNHSGILREAGFKVLTLPYYFSDKHSFDFPAFYRELNKIPPKTIVILHAACHNPTGCDPSMAEWEQIAEVIEKRELIPFFDFAYQGLGEGLDEDAKAIRMFLKKGKEFIVAYSCSKNFSLYCQRVGALYIICPNTQIKQTVGSQIKRLIRTLYSNPPSHGPQIALQVLKDPQLKMQWRSEVEQMRQRLVKARNELIHKLEKKSTQIDFSFARNHKGMFSYLDLTDEQVSLLKEKYAIYTLESGRINVAGLTDANINAVVDGILAVCN